MVLYYIKKDGVLKVSFLIDWRDNINKKEKKEDKNTKVFKPKIKPTLKDKKKYKQG